MPRAVRERVLARARVARLPGLAADEVQDEDVLDAERLPELLLAALEDVVGVRERQEALLGAEELLEELCEATGDDAQTFLGEGLGVRAIGPRPPRNLERGAAERELERRARAQRNLHLGA